MSHDVIVTPESSRRIRAGYPWAWEQDLLQDEATTDVVSVHDAKGRALGAALRATRGPLRLRMLGTDRPVLDDALLRHRLERALERRARTLGPRSTGRVVHAEADQLPGLVIDRYEHVAVLQTATAAMDVREASIALACRDVLGVSTVVQRDDGSARDLEGLERRRGVLLGDGPTTVTYDDAGSSVEVDVLQDPKTGGFLDQRDNHQRARALARGEALDVFACQGGFALALHRGGASAITAVEQDEASARRITRNLERNGCPHGVVRVENAFDTLRSLDESGQRFDTIVLDPPAFAKRKSALEGATRAYRELNRRALRMLQPGGVLFSCSCSGRLGREAFEAILKQAAAEARVVVQVLERRGASLDHPPLLGVPETDYLKVWVLQVVDTERPAGGRR